MKAAERLMAAGFMALCLLGTSLCIAGTVGAAEREYIEPERVMISTPTYEVREWERAVELPVYAEPEPEPRYGLTDAERDLVERVVMAEAGGEGYEGQALVAQCILGACETDGIRPTEAVERYRYTGARPEPSESVREAVTAVFDRGETVTGEPILYFYAPERCRSGWHESQRFVMERGGHRFFAPTE